MNHPNPQKDHYCICTEECPIHSPELIGAANAMFQLLKEEYQRCQTRGHCHYSDSGECSMCVNTRKIAEALGADLWDKAGKKS